MSLPTSHDKPDAEELAEGGDLGLGYGLKPGGIPNVDLQPQRSSDSVHEQLHNSSEWRRASSPTHSTHNWPFPNLPGYEATNGQDEDKNAVKEKVMSIISHRLKLTRRVKSMNLDDQDVDSDHFPSFAEVPFGTSLKQQKKLFEHDINEIFPHAMPSNPKKDDKGTEQKKGNDKAVKVLQKKLQDAELEVEVLRQDLELCQEQLQAKYTALRVLQKQNSVVQSQQQDKTQKAKFLNRQLIQDLNQLQFQFEYQQSSLMDSQDLWVDRFNRVCEDNSALTTQLESRMLEMKKLTSDKMSIQRERDELLALLDVQDRQRYDVMRSASTEEQAYNSFTSSELAILGACRCHNRDPQPCGCAHAAAYMKREICRLRDELEMEQRRSEEGLVTSDAYRMAFEEQLNRNRAVVKQMAKLLSTSTPQPSKASKFKAAVKWLIKQLNEDESVMKRDNNNEKKFRQNNVSSSDDTGRLLVEDTASPTASASKNTNSSKLSSPANGISLKSEEWNAMSQPELIDMLTEMISDRSEALAHQRLAAHMLAKRAEDLEKRLTEVTEGEDIFLSPCCSTASICDL